MRGREQMIDALVLEMVQIKIKLLWPYLIMKLALG
jgi:hypothetical protein